MRTVPWASLPEIVQNDRMASKERKSETVKVSRLGCMRKSTVETDMAGKTVEHVEVWVDDVADEARAAKVRKRQSDTEKS